jgi:hypothetical protein
MLGVNLCILDAAGIPPKRKEVRRDPGQAGSGLLRDELARGTRQHVAWRSDEDQGPSCRAPSIGSGPAHPNRLVG